MGVTIYFIRDRKTGKVSTLNISHAGPNSPAYVCPPDPGDKKDEIPSKLKKKIDDEKKKIN